ncbi:MAG: 4-hydroxy-tetrahydrodipicolinate synthase [Verrucomicrobiota bacterium]
MFEGVYTAIVTPFNPDGSVDYDALIRHVEFQVQGGVDGIVPVGTTGESPTVDFEEHMRIIDVTAQAVNGRVKVIAGTGANSTSEALMLTTKAKEFGCDGTLQVTPYYNKPNDNGLRRHFELVADIGLPVMLYNVPGRSGLEISIDLIKQLSDHENIVSVKEAGGSVDRVSQILSTCDPGSISVVSGDDALALPMIAVGADGVVSVASNIIPETICEIVHSALGGDFDHAQKIHLEYHPLFVGLFMETNPIPVKTALKLMGRMGGTFRLPLAPMDGDTDGYDESTGKTQKLEELLAQHKVI